MRTSGIEMSNLVLPHGDSEQGNHTVERAKLIKTKREESVVQRLMQAVDERCNVKVIMRQWKPRLDLLVRLMLVATFFDDSLRTMTQFSGLIKELSEQGFISWLGLGVNAQVLLATLLLGIGCIAQLYGSICVLLLLQTDNATKVLISWAIVQPVLFAQLSNMEFLSESFSLIGGLFLIRAHIALDPKSYEGARIQLLGRILLPAMYLYHAGVFLMSALTLDETNSVAVYITSLTLFVFNAIALVSLVISSTLVAAGLKSRLVAFFLAMLNIGFVFYQHPFFLFIKLEEGEWKYDEVNMWMPSVALPKDVTVFDFDSSQIYDLHKYYFFLGISTSGALLLLAQLGPGEIAAQKEEVLLPFVNRAQD